MESVLAMILAGGRGKRMDILCHLRPKPALAFAGGFRVIDFALSNCIHSQIGTIGVLIDYQRLAMANYLKEWYLANQGPASFDILIPKAGSYAGTADAVHQNLGYLRTHNADPVLILAGDHIYKMDYRKMLFFHQQVKADVTVGIVPVPIEQAHRFGIVTVDAEGRIVDFAEKPRIPQSNLVSMGIYVFNRRLLSERLAEDAAQTDSLHDFGHSILPRIVRRDRVFAYKFAGYWQDIGTVESYYKANLELTRQVPSFSLDSQWPIFTRQTHSLSPHISEQGSIRDSLVSSGCMIKGVVENSVLSPGVRVEEKAVVRNSVIMANTFVGYYSVVDRCVLDEGVNVDKFCYIGFGATLVSGEWDITVLGRGVTVPSHTAIGRNCKIYPGVSPLDFTTTVVPSGTLVSRRRSFPDSELLGTGQGELPKEE